MLTQGVIYAQCCQCLLLTPSLGGLFHQRYSTVVHRFLSPGCLAEESRQVGFICTIHDASGNIGHTPIR